MPQEKPAQKPPVEPARQQDPVELTKQIPLEKEQPPVEESTVIQEVSPKTI